MRPSVPAVLAILASSLALAPASAHAEQVGKVPAADFDQVEQLRRWSAFVQSLDPAAHRSRDRVKLWS